MKSKTVLLLVMAVLLSMTSFSQEKRWVFLGEKLVNNRLDHDVLMVTAARGDFRGVQIRVKGAAVEFYKVVIVFGDGQRQEVELRHVIPAGGMSRVIDLPGGNRIIHEIDFWYNANTILWGKALVRVFGRN